MTDELHQSRTPRLRFPEFQDAGEWDEKRLGTLLLRSPDYGVNAPAVPYAPDLPAYLRITDISEDGLYLTAKKVSVAIDAIDENYLHEGDLVLARTGASVGKSYQYKKEDGKLVFAGFLIRIRPDQKQLNPTFLFNFLSTQQYWKWVGITSARSGQPGINSSEYASLLIPIPPDAHGRGLAEQQKIADCLSSLDAVISAQRAKLDALTSHKQGLMQQVFPAEGETVPRLRFPAFQGAGEWEEKQLEELVDIIDGDRGKNYPKSEDFSNTGFCVFLNAKNVTERGFVFDEVQFITRKKDISLNKGKLKRGDIVLTTRGSVGNFAFFSSDVFYDHLRINSGMAILRVQSDYIDSAYLYIYLQSKIIDTMIERVVFGSAQPQLTVTAIKKFPLWYPTIAEQRKIAECLDSLNTMINAHCRKLTALIDLKQSLMQQLFPITKEDDNE